MARPEASGTIGLLGDLLGQVFELLGLEFDLLRVELTQSSSRAVASLGRAAAGAAFLMAGLLVLLTAFCAFLVRLGLPVDGACLLVAAIALLAGWLCLRSGMRNLEPGALIPRRSLNQITSLVTRT
jgi:hypothetical protein